MTEMWAYRDATSNQGQDLVGYDVQATDGSIGSVDEATYDATDAYVVVDTGFWIFGKKRLVPAGVINTVDHDAEKVYVTTTKEQIKSAPDYDRDDWNDGSRTRYNDYYSSYAR